tara:strand:- start:157 stop:660 length:504 start_codon:yes stop_codon:yes gene_type:complete
MRYLIAILIICSPLSASAETIKSLDRLCHKIDVQSAEYVAGVDVHGKKVVPADLGADLGALTEPIIIPVNVDLEKLLGKAMPELSDFQSNIANIKIYKDGRITYNDKEISVPLNELCSSGNAKEIQEKTPSQPAKGNGQERKDNVTSDDIIKGQYPDDEDKKPVYND